MPVPFDPVVVLQKERFNHGGELHIQIQDIDREGDDEESEEESENLQ